MKKNKQKRILILLLLAMLIAGGVWLASLFQTNQNENPEESRNSLFPFGEIFPGEGTNNQGNQNTLGDDNEDPQQQALEQEEQGNAFPKLRVITTEPTGGFVPFSRVEKMDIIETRINEEGAQVRENKTIEVENQYIRYSSIENGTVYETKITDDRSFSEDIVVENFIPNAEIAEFSSNGNNIAFQYWDKKDRAIETYLAKIQELSYEIEPCPYSFEGSLEVGEESSLAFDLHQFFNKDPQTQIAISGVNSPGNEGFLVSKSTIQGIEKFQQIYELDVDGSIGRDTRAEMLRVCDEQQEKTAQEVFATLSTKNKITGSFLPEDIISLTMSPRGDELFYLKEETFGISGKIVNFETQDKKEVFNSPFSEWVSHWSSENNIEITTKPTYAAEGYSYQLDPNKGTYYKSLASRKGLTVLPSNDNKRLLVHDVEQGRPLLSLHDRESNQTISLGIETFTDKCVWSKNDTYIYCSVPNSLSYNEEYPDVWYQGLETYEDVLWEINTQTLQKIVLSNLEVDHGEKIDVEKIMVDDSDQYLYFIDKNSESLWSYRINNK